MNILIVGSGGREHVLADAYAKNKKVKRIFITPGNPFIDYSNKKVTGVPGVLSTDYDRIKTIIWKNKIDLVDVAQDDPIAEGFVDRLTLEGVKAFGPTQKAAQIEWSKEWARDFMKKYDLPIPEFKVFTSSAKAIVYLKKQKEQKYYVKASGLALGKGAIKADTKYEAAKAVHSMKNFGKAGSTFLIEECLDGEEFSAFAVSDGESFKILGFAQDHKKVFDHDRGPNTGGMGCISRPKVVDAKVFKETEKIFSKLLIGMKKEGRQYAGIIYLGGMITKSGLKIIEFNSRWGDPEAQVIIPGIKTDYLDIVNAVLEKRLNKLKIVQDNLVRISVAGASYGYPGDYSGAKGKRIVGLNLAGKIKGINIYGAGIAKDKNHFVVSGGRVFHMASEGKTVQEAKQNVYSAMSKVGIVGNNLHFRTDIGWSDLEREYEKAH